MNAAPDKVGGDIPPWHCTACAIPMKLAALGAVESTLGCERCGKLQVVPTAVEIARPAALGPWQPFDTAPTDSTHILAYFPRHPIDDDENMDESIDLGGVQAVTWRSGDGWVEPDYLDASGSWFGDDFCYAPAPTFWMPLLANPVKAAGGAL